MTHDTDTDTDTDELAARLDYIRRENAGLLTTSELYDRENRHAARAAERRQNREESMPLPDDCSPYVLTVSEWRDKYGSWSVQRAGRGPGA